MSLERLNDIDFVDLYLGLDYCDIKRATPGELFRRESFSKDDGDLAALLRERCAAEYVKCSLPEFGLRIGHGKAERLYRVTAITDSRRQNVFVLRKSSASLRSMSELGLPPHIVNAIMTPGLKGLVLVVGDTASGKTSTLATIVHERLLRFSGVALTIEQPVEVPLEGLHGEGRCIQHEIATERNGYAEALSRALRTNPNLIMLGEIRHPFTALEAVMAGLNGHLIVSTMHASSVENAIERFNALISMAMPPDETGNVRSLVASSLALVIHQHLVPTTQSPRLLTSSLNINDERTGSSVRSKIREGRISGLNQEIDQQKQTSAWSPQAGQRSRQTKPSEHSHATQ